MDMRLDKRTDQLLNRSMFMALVALVGWIGFLLADDGRVYLALGIVSTVVCAVLKVQAELAALERRLTQPTDRPTA